MISKNYVTYLRYSIFKTIKAGSINYHRISSLNFYEIRFVIFWLLFI